MRRQPFQYSRHSVSREQVAPSPFSPETDVEQQGLLFIEEVLRGVEHALSKIEWSLLISLLRGDDPAGAYRRLQKISAQVDGLLIAETVVTSEQLAVVAARIPVVLVAGSSAEPHDVVGADNRSGIRALVAHLTEEHAARRLFCIAGPPDAPDAQDRLRALTEAVAERPDVTLTGLFEGRFSALSGQLAVREILARHDRELPDALVCGNDQMAIGAIRELQTAGLRVPADIAVVGFDDMHAGALMTPALTTVRQPMRLLGERATQRLLERIADPGLATRTERLATELVIRETCGCDNQRWTSR